MRSREEIRRSRAQTFYQMKQTGVLWILMLLMGAAAVWSLYRYLYWKDAPIVPAHILSWEEQKGSHSTVTYKVHCEYTDPNGDKHTAVYVAQKMPQENETQVYVDPKHPDRITGPNGPKSYLMLFWIFGGVTVLGCVAGAL